MFSPALFFYLILLITSIFYESPQGKIAMGVNFTAKAKKITNISLRVGWHASKQPVNLPDSEALGFSCRQIISYSHSFSDAQAINSSRSYGSMEDASFVPLRGASISFIHSP